MNKEIEYDKIYYHKYQVPLYMVDGLKRWIERGIYPGSFLTAVIENDLFAALSNADETNINALPAYGYFFYNEAPHGCYGSKKIAKAWHEAGGLNGEKE